MCESCAPVEFLSASWRHVSLVRSFIISWIGVSGGGGGGGRSASRRPASATSSSSPSGACSCALTAATWSRSSAKRAGRRTCHDASTFRLASARAPSSRSKLALATAAMRTVAGSASASPSCSATSVATSERHSNEATQSRTLRDACFVEACSRSSVSRSTSSAVALPSPTHSLHTSQCVAHSAGDKQTSIPSITACTAGSVARESSCNAQPASSIGRCLGSRVSSSTSPSERSWIEVHQSPSSQPPSA